MKFNKNVSSAALLSVVLLAMFVGCLKDEIQVDQSVVINVKDTGSFMGDSCEITVKMEDGASKIFTGTRCFDVGSHICVSKSMTPAIIEGCSW